MATSGKVSVSSLSLKEPHWTLAEKSPNENVFVSRDGDVVGIELRTEETVFKVDFNDLASLRSNIRMGFGGAGLISADIEEYGTGEAKVRGVAIITKLPQLPAGMSYNGLIFLPFKDFSYSLYMRYEEGGISGAREAAVLEPLIAAGEVKLVVGAAGAVLDGFDEDLYEPSLRGHLVRNKAEREEFDGQFPEHPLSKLRACLRSVKESLQIDQIVLESEQDV
ncbi:MAG: hypothetical protein JST01_21815 [Cyanobacteria bacterium SZAS TMP-1]|nr:hypothetical protein [Cyanobacteria bacterium SZAS TMP-1]